MLFCSHTGNFCNSYLYDFKCLTYSIVICWLVGWLCLTSHRQRGHLDTAPPFTVPCEGREA